MFASCLKLIHDSIIDLTQSGFMCESHRQQQITLVLDIIDYSDLMDTMVHLVFQNAFDTSTFFFFFYFGQV